MDPPIAATLVVLDFDEPLVAGTAVADALALDDEDVEASTTEVMTVVLAPRLDVMKAVELRTELAAAFVVTVAAAAAPDSPAV